MTERLVFSHDLPTTDGWYWHHWAGSAMRPKPVYVRIELCGRFTTDDLSLMLCDTPQARKSHLWAGPIPYPIEPPEAQ